MFDASNSLLSPQTTPYVCHSSRFATFDIGYLLIATNMVDHGELLSKFWDDNRGIIASGNWITRPS